jgi:hypothetical protein
MRRRRARNEEYAWSVKTIVVKRSLLVTVRVQVSTHVVKACNRNMSDTG